MTDNYSHTLYHKPHPSWVAFT